MNSHISPKISRLAIILATLTAVSLSVASPAQAVVSLPQQSPVDIVPGRTVFSALPTLHFSYSSNAHLNVLDTGSPHEEATIRAEVDPGAGTLELSGHTWNLLQFHFHTGSEHLLNGHATPMEMHMVHKDSDGNLLVVGRWIDEGSFNSTFDVDLPVFGHPVSLNGFNLNNLLPASMQSFRYDGSLTTPGFSEGVKWVVMNERLTLSHDQITTFQQRFPHGNTREVQELNGRLIMTDVPGFTTAVPEPENWVMLFAGLGLIGGIVRRRSLHTMQ